MKKLLPLILSAATFLVIANLKILIFGKFLIAIVAAITMYIASKKVIKKFTGVSTEEKLSEMDKANQALVREGIRKLYLIRQKTRMIKKNEIAQKIQDICKVGMEIFDYIKKNPKDVKKAKQFINYYLDSTEKIVSRYIDLSNMKNISPEVEKSLIEVEEILNSIEDTFKKQMDSMLDDDLLDLDTEIKVLKNTMKMEG